MSLCSGILILNRGASFAREFVGEATRALKLDESVSQEYSQKIQFDLGTVFGRSDASMLKKKLNLKEPIEKFAAGTERRNLCNL